MYRHIHTHSHTNIYIYTHTHTHTYTHIHKQLGILAKSVRKGTLIMGSKVRNPIVCEATSEVGSNVFLFIYIYIYIYNIYI